MTVENVLMMLGGLALFFYGMNNMSEALEAAAGKRLKTVLGKLTSNRFAAVGVGAGLTAVVQSSSATTVMLVGFVNAGLMSLGQAISIVMGANIGTTITGQMMALNLGEIAPAIALVGVVCALFFKKNRALCYTGQIFASFGILFMGMDMMSSAMAPLRTMPGVVEILSNLQNPLVGILVGTIFVAVIQSSAAALGIMQALAASGVVSLPTAVFFIFGMNIGTCMTSLLASFTASRSAKRVSLFHIVFNVIGTILFTGIFLIFPGLVDWVAGWTSANVMAQLANMHTLFNVATTIILFPFVGWLERLVTMILPVKPNEGSELHLVYLDTMRIGSTTVAVTSLCKEIMLMAERVSENFRLAADAIMGKTPPNHEKIASNEEYIDYLNVQISNYISKVVAEHEMPLADAAKIHGLFRISGDLERVGDHSENLADYTRRISEESLSFSEEAVLELGLLRAAIESEMKILLGWKNRGRMDELDEFIRIEHSVDAMTREFRENQIARIGEHRCQAEAGVLYSEMLTDLERVGDHLMNIAQTFFETELDFEGERGRLPSASAAAPAEKSAL